MLFTYQKLVFRTAWRLFQHRSRDWGIQVMSFVFRTTIVFGILFFVPWFGDVRAESRLVAAAAASVVLSVSLSFFWDLLRAPQVIWSELTRRLADADRRLSPCFSVVPNVGSRPIYPAPQHVSVTLGGSIQSLRTLSGKYLCVEVTNSSAKTLKACEAYLSRFRRMDGEDPGWHAMRLEWMPVGEPTTSIDIPPLGVRSVMVFRELGNRALFLTTQVPGELVHYITDKGEYEGIITLTADDTTATFIAFTLICDAPDQEPMLNVLRGTIGDVSGDIAWAPETSMI